MELSIDDLSWNWFRGNEVHGSLLQDVCLFRSFVLYDSGFRKNFGAYGRNFGDVQFSDFDSYHIVARAGKQVLGTVRVTPPQVETVAASVLGPEDYQSLIAKLGTDLDHVIEINRLMIDGRVRKLNLGRTLMYASVALIENLWDRSKMTIIGSAGNCTKQAQFFLNYTDYEKIPGVSDHFASTFNDHVTFLRYKQPPYVRGAEWIESFKKILGPKAKADFHRLEMAYDKKDLIT